MACDCKCKQTLEEAFEDYALEANSEKREELFKHMTMVRQREINERSMSSY